MDVGVGSVVATGVEAGGDAWLVPEVHEAPIRDTAMTSNAVLNGGRFHGEVGDGGSGGGGDKGGWEP